MSVVAQLKPEDVVKRRLAASKKLRREIEKAQEKFRRYGVAYLRQKALDQRIWFKGRFYKGISADRRASLGLTIEFRNTARHAIFVEAGRRAGARRPPIRAILPWVMLKFGLDEARALSVAFAVATNISKRGIKARPVIRSAANQRHLKREYEKATKALLVETLR